MKITEILIQRFGAWRDTSFPVGRSGLNVFFGPNEAGKSTLMRFVRGVLYGYPAAGPLGPGAGSSGALRIEHDGRAWEVRREGATDSTPRESMRGDAVVSLLNRDENSPSATDRLPLEQILCGVTEDVYQRIFAVGLDELQQFATLQGDEVARRIYGASLGSEGRRLLQAFGKCRADREKLASASSETGFARLLDRDARIRSDLAATADLRARHDGLLQERQKLQERIAIRKSQLAGWQNEVRALDLMSRTWAPWREVDELKRELSRLPDVRTFPERGSERLAAIETETAALKKTRTQLLKDAIELRRRAGKQRRESGLDQSRRKLWSLLDQRDVYQGSVARLTDDGARHAAARREFDARLAALGSDWTRKRLESLDVSQDSQNELLTRARRYQSTVARRNTIRKQLKGWSRACRSRSAEVATRLKELDAGSLETALAESRQKLADLQEFVHLKRDLRDHDARRDELKAHSSRLSRGLSYPTWLPLLLWFFAIGGLAAAALGFYQGFQQNGVAGVMWALLGATCGGLAFAVRSHYDGAVYESSEHWTSQLLSYEDRTRKIEQALDQLKRRAPWLHQIGAPISAERPSRHPKALVAEPEVALLEETKSRHAELERLAGIQQQVARRRGRLSSLRSRFQQAHRDVTTSRQEWCGLLQKLGMANVSRVGDAFDTWKKLTAAQSALRELQTASQSAEESRRMVSGFDDRVKSLGRELGEVTDGSGSTLVRLSSWEQKSDGLDGQNSESRKLLAEARRKRKEASECTRRLKGLRSQRRALLREARCRTRPQFERKARAFDRRSELIELLEIAEADLSKAAGHERELAIVDEDFRAYDPEKATVRGTACRSEIAAAERELETLHQRIGAATQELAALEADEREIGLRASRAEVQNELASRSRQWAALSLAQRTLDDVRTRFERVSQPATLVSASNWLGRLTRGRFRKVWTPLGSQELRVEDERGESLGVEQMSTGSREQLFLSIRLALIRDFQQKGVELPIVLDDILVNFDQERTEAALDALNEFADEGQQILLFTCHRHVAQLAQERNIEPVRLPVRDTVAEAAREERRAG